MSRKTIEGKKHKVKISIDYAEMGFIKFCITKMLIYIHKKALSLLFVMYGGTWDEEETGKETIVQDPE